MDVYAGVKQTALSLIAGRPGLRMIEPPFMSIQQAMATPKGRSTGAVYLRAFIEDMKATGFVARALERAKRQDGSERPLS